MGLYFYIETGSDTDPAALAEALERAGISVSTTQETGCVQGGVVLTVKRAEELWNYETGYYDCEGACRESDVRHRSFTEIAPETQERFTALMCASMNRYVHEFFDAGEELGEHGEFAGHATHRCPTDQMRS